MVMSQNFIGCDREQVLLMPPGLREWLPQNHLAWFVLGAVEEMDLESFYAAYRADGHGRAAHEPSMMVGLLVYAYARGQRSSRRIEQACKRQATRAHGAGTRHHRAALLSGTSRPINPVATRIPPVALRRR